MRSLSWERTKRIADVRHHIWSYVTPASRFEQPGLLVAAALLGWPEADALRLGELQFLLSPETGVLLESMPRLVRRLATASTRGEQWSHERIHGPIQWNRTLALRAATGAPQLFVTAPAERVYQTPENELLVHVLDAIVSVAQSSGWDQSRTQARPARTVRERLAEAERWRQSRMISSVERIPPTSRSLARIRSGRTRQHYAPALAAHEQLVSMVERPDRQAIRSAVENTALVTARDSTLFELLTTFHLIEELRANGWPVTKFQFHRKGPYARGRRSDGREIYLWYQSVPNDLDGLGAGSEYIQTLAAHGFTGQPDLRPDIILKWNDENGATRWLLIECKLYRVAENGARHALTDLLSYRRAFDQALAGAGTPCGLGVAWGAELEPADTEITLCTPDKLGQAVRRIVR